jgi:preprotein translocase subunit SecG
MAISRGLSPAVRSRGKEVAVAYVPFVLNILIMLTGLFLIGLVLIQRGKGGGLAGAFGGIGGSSAFGSRAGDTFTRITIYVALFWALLIMISIKVVPLTVQGQPGDTNEVIQPAPGGPPIPEGDAP